MSPVFRREEGFVFKIHSNEEERMHLYVIKAENEAKIWLEPQVEVAWNDEFSSSEIKKIIQIIRHMQSSSDYNTRATSASVLMINSQGLMLSVLGNDYFVSYNRLPWLQEARVQDVLNVRMSGKHAIEWPALDIDIEVESLKHPERYPLVMKRSEFDSTIL